MITKITLISVLVLMSVLMFVHRIYNRIREQNLFPNSLLTKIGTAHFVFIFLLYFIFFLNPFHFWMCAFVSVALVPAIVFVVTIILQQHFYSEFLRFVSVVILKMQMGHSFVSSMEQALATETWRQKGLLSEIHRNVVFSQQVKIYKSGPFNSFVGKVVHEFHLIYFNQHQAIDRLCNFRKNLQAELFFRRRSRQIWTYFAYQLALLSFIYFALFIFIVREYGFFQFKTAFYYSFSLYFFGIVSLYFIIRGKKWRI